MEPLAPIFERLPWLKWLLGGGSAGVAVTLGLALITAVEKHPEFLPQLLNGNVLFFCTLLAGIVVFDRRLQGFTELQQRHVSAQEQLALNVGALVSKDDQRAREQEILLGHLARQTDTILRYLEEQRQGHT